MDIDSILSDSHRKRALQKKRQADAKNPRRHAHLNFHLRKVHCEIRMSGVGSGASSVHDAFVLGPDLAFNRIHLFSRRGFAESQSVELTVYLGEQPQFLTGYVRTIRSVSRLGSRLWRIEILLDSPSGSRERASFMEFLREFQRRTLWSDRF